MRRAAAAGIMIAPPFPTPRRLLANRRIQSRRVFALLTTPAVWFVSSHAFEFCRENNCLSSPPPREYKTAHSAADADERAQRLVGSMTLAEKVHTMTGDTSVISVILAFISGLCFKHRAFIIAPLTRPVLLSQICR